MIYFAATPQWKYKDYWGYEIDIQDEASRILNYTYTIENPPDGLFNYIVYLSGQNMPSVDLLFRIAYIFTVEVSPTN